jgi:ribosome-associated toxin RatA of RatAB toxin-antitoxin module
MTFEESIVIAAAPGELFALTQDYARRLEWDPFLRSAELLCGATAPGVGVRAYCVATSGWGMETEYVSFNPPRTTAVKMTRGPWLIETFAGSWRFEELSEGRTRVGFRYHLRVRPRWLSWLLAPIVGRAFRRDTRRRLVALKAAVEERGLLSDRKPSGPDSVVRFSLLACSSLSFLRRRL